MQLAEAFIQSNLECIQSIQFYQYVFPGILTHNPCAAITIKLQEHNKCEQ